MIEDTSFIIDILQDDPDALTYLDLIEKETTPKKSLQSPSSNSTRLSRS